MRRAGTRGLVTFLLLAGGALFAPACDPEEKALIKALGEGCLLDSECEDPLVCVFRKCHYECDTTKDCKGKPIWEPGVRCVKGDKPTNVCLLDVDPPGDAEPVNEVECLDSSECPGGLVCGPDGKCRDACSDSSQCITGQLCVQGTCADPEELNASGLLTDPAMSDEGTPCTYNSDCAQPLVCKASVCLEACKQDVDCPEPATCVVDAPSGKHVCKKPTAVGVPDHCGDGLTSGDETGIDCGGSCYPCPPGQPCAEVGDCQSGVCGAGVCLAPDCSDDVKNAQETGTDCGGPSCDPCPLGEVCTGPSDCASGLLCDQGKCVGPTCQDGQQNDGETGIDCGGPCAGCDPGQPCVVAGDCESASCGGFVCQAASCGDNIKNPTTETGLDCGGSCPPCPAGAGCTSGADCVTGVCGPSSTCKPPGCGDGVKNGLETDVDCGGTCGGCGAGLTCIDDGDCAAGTACKPGSDTCEDLVTLTLDPKGGPGSGSITGAGLSCGLSCAGTFFVGDVVSLHAEPVPPSTFAGWSEPACAATGADCSFALTTDTTLTATFGSSVAPWARSVGGSSASLAAVGPTDTVFAGGDLYVGSLDLGSTVLVGPPSAFWLAAFPPGGGDALWGRVVYDSLTGTAPGVRALLPTPSGDVWVVLEADGDLDVGAAHVACPPGVDNSIALLRFDATGSFVAGACHGLDLKPNAATLDAAGNLVVVGLAYGGTSDAGGGPLPVSLFNGEAFVAKYSPQGAFLAGGLLGGGGMTDALAVAASPAGDALVVAGTCQGTVTFGGLPPKTTAAGTVDACAVRLDAALAPTWQIVRGSPAGGYPQESFTAVAFAPSGEVILAGGFTGQVDFTDDGTDNPSDGGVTVDPVWLRASAVTGLVASTADVHTVPCVDGGSCTARHVVADGAGRIHLLGGGTYISSMGGGICAGVNGQDTVWLATWDALGVLSSSSCTYGFGNDLTLGPSGQLALAAYSNASWLPGLPASTGNHVAQLVP